jgi:hypothetical protein
MADDETTLSCKIIDDESEKALIKTATGQAWIYRSDFFDCQARMGRANRPNTCFASPRDCAGNPLTPCAGNPLTPSGTYCFR